MPRVVCPKASHFVIIAEAPEGVRFAPLGDDGGWLSEQISDDLAAAFCRIRGYSLHEMKIEGRGSIHGQETRQTSVSHKKAASQKETT